MSDAVNRFMKEENTDIIYIVESSNVSFCQENSRGGFGWVAWLRNATTFDDSSLAEKAKAYLMKFSQSAEVVEFVRKGAAPVANIAETDADGKPVGAVPEEGQEIGCRTKHGRLLVGEYWGGLLCAPNNMTWAWYEIATWFVVPGGKL